MSFEPEEIDFVDPIGLFEHVGRGPSKIEIGEHSFRLTAGSSSTSESRTYQSWQQVDPTVPMTREEALAHAQRLAHRWLRDIGIAGIQARTLFTQALLSGACVRRPLSARRNGEPVHDVEPQQLLRAVAERYGCSHPNQVELRLGSVRASERTGQALVSYNVIIKPLPDAPAVVVRGRAYFTKDGAAKRDSLIHALDPHARSRGTEIIVHQAVAALWEVSPHNHFAPAELVGQA